MTIAQDDSARKPSDELECAIQEEARASAALVEASRRVERLLRAREVACCTGPARPASDLDDAAAMAVANIQCKATWRRHKIEPDYYVGTRPRWRDAESVRAKLAARGRKPTTPNTAKAVDSVDVDDLASKAGLRVVGGRR